MHTVRARHGHRVPNHRAFAFVAQLVFCLLAISPGSTSAAFEDRNVTCNVFASGACFGVAPGDKLTMEVIVDFVQYQVAFAGGGLATIYSGYNPSVAQSPAWKPCVSVMGFNDCRERRPQADVIEVIARRDENAPYVHVVVTPKNTPADLIKAFLKTVHPCRRADLSVSCEK